MKFRETVYEIFEKIKLSIKGKFFKTGTRNQSLPDLVEQAFYNFSGKILLIISGNDLTADEFMDKVKYSKRWNDKIQTDPNISLYKIEEANHTFSRQIWKNKVFEVTRDWLTGFDKI